MASDDRAVSQALPPAALSLSHVTFSYPGAAAPVLADTSLSVPEGSFTLLVGDTGSGKSTLLSLAKPEIAPAGELSGEILVFGRPAAELGRAESAQTVGYVFQDPDSQIVCDSVWHEMAFGLEGLGFPQGAMRRRIAETSYFFGMDTWFREPTATLSGGRKQLLALASTLVMRPRLLLLDEPTSQLDPVAERSFLHALFRANRELGCTVVVATHRPHAMVDYATAAFRLAGGRVEPVGDLGSLRSLPALGVPAAGERRAQASPRPALSLRRAWFRYARDGEWVLRGFDLEVLEGEVHALVGGNGCGKSTILDLAAGVLRPQRGARSTSCGRAQALLPQDPKALLTGETVAGELMEWSAGAGYGGEDVARILGELGLSGLEDRHPYDLSGGQRQLLAFGKLLLLRPRLLLLDEPTKGLDAAARTLVARTVDRIRGDGGTVLLASHDLDFVRQVADRVTMVFDGEAACTEGGGEFFRENVYYRP